VFSVTELQYFAENCSVASSEFTVNDVKVLIFSLPLILCHSFFLSFLRIWEGQGTLGLAAEG
jgi:hypothetical protein